MANVKVEEQFRCYCCFGVDNLLCTINPRDCNEKKDLYPIMIAECFRIEINDVINDDSKSNYKICESCVSNLRNAVQFKLEIQTAYDHIEGSERDELNYIELHKSESSSSASLNIKQEKKEQSGDLNCNKKIVTVKCESWSLNCCCCRSKVELHNMTEVCHFVGFDKSIVDRIDECFHIKPFKLQTNLQKDNKNIYMMCISCIYRLNESVHFRLRIKNTYDYIRDTLVEYDSKCELDKHISSVNKINTIQNTLQEKLNDIFNKHESLNINMKSEPRFEAATENLEGTPNKTVEKRKRQSKTSNNISGEKKENLTSNKKKGQCNICGKLFTTKSILRRHEREIHSGVKKFICDYCERAFSKKFDLKRHIISHSDLKETCKFCGKLMGKNYLMRHMKIHKNFTCNICGKCYRRSAHLKSHILSAHPEDESDPRNPKPVCSIFDTGVIDETIIKKDISPRFKVKCDVCEKMFVTETNLRKHTNEIHLNNKEFNCDYCGECFSQKLNLKRHISSHPESKEMCTICKKLISKTYIRQHERNHLNLYNFTCNICGEGFLKNTHLNSHILFSHPENANDLNLPKYICDICGKQYTEKFSLKRHVSSHYRIIKGKCKICKEMFTCRNSLVEHMKIHPNAPKHTCEMCEKSYYNVFELRKHIRFAHLDPKETCGVCGKSVLKRSFAAHKKIHLKIYDFSCDTCGKKFRQKNNLKTHISYTHMKIMEKCDICCKLFASKSSLNIHMKIHSDV